MTINWKDIRNNLLEANLKNGRAAAWDPDDRKLYYFEYKEKEGWQYDFEILGPVPDAPAGYRNFVNLRGQLITFREALPVGYLYTQDAEYLLLDPSPKINNGGGLQYWVTQEYNQEWNANGSCFRFYEASFIVEVHGTFHLEIRNLPSINLEYSPPGENDE